MSVKDEFKEAIILYTVIGYNDLGEEVGRAKGLTEEEMNFEVTKYYDSSIMQSEVVVPKTYCEVDGTRVAVAIIRLYPGEKPIKVCRYHSAGVMVKFKPDYPVIGKLYYKGFIVAKDALCAFFCPSYWEEKVKVDGKTVVRGECRAYKEPRSKKEQRKRDKGYSIYGRNYSILCLQDPWWRR